MIRQNPIGYYGKKLLILICSILLLSVLVFTIARLAPGDPLVSYYGDRAEKMTPAEREWAMEKLGLQDSIPVQYLRWLQEAMRGNFGISYKYKQDVTRVIGSRIGNTVCLGGIGFVLTFALALGLGTLCAWFENRWPDRLLCKIGTFTCCIPEFWMSLVLILIFSVQLGVLPSSGAYTVGKAADWGDRATHLILPLTVVISGHVWYYAYMIRNRFLEEIRADYVLLAKSKGLSRRRVLLGHCLRNVLPTYFSVMAISVPHILGGTYIVETVFSYPGLGTLSYESARYQDYNLLMLLSLMTGAVVIFCNLVSQIINERIDPRIKIPREVHLDD